MDQTSSALLFRNADIKMGANDSWLITEGSVRP